MTVGADADEILLNALKSARLDSTFDMAMTRSPEAPIAPKIGSWHQDLLTTKALEERVIPKVPERSVH